MAGVGLEIIYDPDDEARDITNVVLIKSARLESSSWAQPGIWQATVRDLDQTQSFVTGKRIIWKLDGTTFYAGFLTQVTKTFALPTDDTTTPGSVKTRQFQLRGVDYNILFDKRVVRNTANYQTSIPQFSRTWDKTVVEQLCDDYLDLPTWLDTSTMVDQVGQIPMNAGATGVTYTPSYVNIIPDQDDVTVGYLWRIPHDYNPGSLSVHDNGVAIWHYEIEPEDGTFMILEGNPTSLVATVNVTYKGAWVTQGSPWRKQMQSFSGLTGAIWYIQPNGNGADLVWRAVEDGAAPYTLSDKPTGAEQGFRELQYIEDASGMVNDALVWGGSEYSNVDGWPTANVLFARKKNDTSIAAHNRWQWAETHFGDAMNYSSQDEVDIRAKIIVLGQTGDTVYAQNRGLQNPNETFTIAWHHIDVPKIGDVYQFIKPGDLTTLDLHVFNRTIEGANPVILPCRSIAVTFPSGTADGNAIVRFEGTFSLQVNDPWTLWQAIARRKQVVVPNL